MVFVLKSTSARSLPVKMTTTTLALRFYRTLLLLILPVFIRAQIDSPVVEYVAQPVATAVPKVRIIVIFACACGLYTYIYSPLKVRKIDQAKKNGTDFS